MKKVSLIAMLLIAVMMIVGCSHNAEVSKNADKNDSVSFSASKTENSNSKIVAENESSTEVSTTETTTAQSTTKPKKTNESTTAKTTTAKPNDKKSAGQGTTKKQTQTTTKNHTATQSKPTTQKETTTKKETTTNNQTTSEKPFDVNYWVRYAKNYAKSVGLNLDSGATTCWDNPINANSKCIYLERDIKGMLNRYAKDDDITDVWIWAEQTGSNSYQIYIGYA